MTADRPISEGHKAWASISGMGGFVIAGAGAAALWGWGGAFLVYGVILWASAMVETYIAPRDGWE